MGSDAFAFWLPCSSSSLDRFYNTEFLFGFNKLEVLIEISDEEKRFLMLLLLVFSVLLAIFQCFLRLITVEPPIFAVVVFIG